MVLRFVVALALGALIGAERELVGKYEAGVRTAMLVAGGAAIFSIVAIMLPYIIATPADNVSDIIAHNSGFLNVIANIVVGIGFLGAGIIIKTEAHVHGTTTAATIWATAAVGTLVGIGLIWMAIISSAIIAALLYLLRNWKTSERFNGSEG